MEEDEAGVIGVVCEGVELEIERDATTEDDAVSILRQTLGTNEEFALDRAISLWCKRFDIEMPSTYTDGDDAVSVIAKWMFWVIQAKSLLKTRFSQSNKNSSNKNSAKKDPLEDLVLGEWAGELELDFSDIELLFNDLQCQDDVVRDLAFWFANKAQAERLHALEARGGGSDRYSDGSDLRTSTVIRKSRVSVGGMSDADGRDMNKELNLLVKKKRKEQAKNNKTSSKQQSSSQDEEQEGGNSSATSSLMRSAQISLNNQQQHGRGGQQGQQQGEEGSSLVGFDEMSSDEKLKAFQLLSCDEKAEILIDLTPIERLPLINSIKLEQFIELIAMDDVVLSLNSNELRKASETSLSDRALAITRLGRQAKFKLFTLEGSIEAMELESLRRATLSTYDPNAGSKAIEVAIAARLNLYYLLDHKSRIEIMGSFTDRRERNDLLKSLQAEDRQEFIDACITAEMVKSSYSSLSITI